MKKPNLILTRQRLNDFIYNKAVPPIHAMVIHPSSLKNTICLNFINFNNELGDYLLSNKNDLLSERIQNSSTCWISLLSASL